jgi:hypothetical protein
VVLPTAVTMVYIAGMNQATGLEGELSVPRLDSAILLTGTESGLSRAITIKAAE